jgi:hypothetical protein
LEFKELKLKILREFDNQQNFANVIGMHITSLNQRLNGKVEWKISEVEKACNLLHIENNDIALYFFSQKV